MENKDKQFITGLENNLDEIKTEQAAGAKVEGDLAGAGQSATAAQGVPNTAQEVPVMNTVSSGQGAPTMNAAPTGDFLTPAEEQAQKAQLAEKRGVNVPLIVLIAIVILALAAVAGMAATKLLGNDEQKEPGTSIEGGGATDGGEGDGDAGDDDSTDIEELAVDDELVQRLYGRFSVAKNPWDGKWNFYVDKDVTVGKPGRYLILTLAEANLFEKRQDCRGSYEYEFNDGTVVQLTECYAGEDMRQEIKEMFGEDMVFTEEDIAGTVCGGFQYSSEFDEFHAVGSGCGGTWPASIIGKIVKAERSGDNLFIYEKALLQQEVSLYKISDIDGRLGAGELVDDSLVNYDWENGSAEEFNKLQTEKIDEYFEKDSDIFKWTFTKNAEGNYVFAGLERL